MGRIQTPELAQDYIDFLFSPAVAVQDMHSGAIALALNAKTRRLLWGFIKENWEMVYRELSGNMVVLERFLRVGLSKFADGEVEGDIRGFFEGRDNKGYDRGLGVVADTIKGAAAYRERDAGLVREWLGAHGYL